MFRLRVRYIKLSRQKRRDNHAAMRQSRPQRGGIMRDFGAHSEVRQQAIQTACWPPQAAPRLGEFPQKPPVILISS